MNRLVGLLFGLEYEIIDAYMRNNDVSLAELMTDENYQALLEKSKFTAK
ncbi:MAG: hypothetical protein HC905_05825 [Bacteroidales bacterium]|nr:hypothetical protein [Bacteroidales bacterium]